MQTVGANTKLCVTCAMYDGPRVPKEYFVDYEQFSCGKCYARFPQGVDCKPTYSCRAWTKWSAYAKRNMTLSPIIGVTS